MTITATAIEFDFDPWFHAGSLLVRWEAIALAIVVGICLLIYGRSVRRTVARVRTDDVVFVVLAAIPGAVVGGRLVHGLSFLDAYAANPAALLDLGRGSLSLAGAVVGGVLSAAYVCRLLGYSPGRWLDAAAVPLLLAIGFGKLAMALGGAGQGAAFGGPLATAYVGSGWMSASAATPAYPSQVYEGLWALLGALIVYLLGRRAADNPARSGRRFAAAISWWLIGRLVIGFTWRDQPVLGPFNVEQLAAAALLIVVAATVPLAWLMRPRPGDRGTADGSPDNPPASLAPTPGPDAAPVP